MGLASLRACKEARRKDSSELGRGNEAEETGQIRENLHGSCDQRGNQANELARPPGLKDVSSETIARTQAQRQGGTAAQSNLELVHVGQPGEQRRRDEGVGAQEQESVAGDVLVVIGRGVIKTRA